MSSETQAAKSASRGGHSTTPPNTVAVIGLVLIAVCMGLCGLMFVMADGLPDAVQQFRESETLSTTHLRLLILGCSTFALSVVALVLCVVGLLTPNRRRPVAVVGTMLSTLVVLGVFGVLLVGVMLNPQATPSTSGPPEDDATPVAAETFE